MMFKARIYKAADIKMANVLKFIKVNISRVFAVRMKIYGS